MVYSTVSLIKKKGRSTDVDPTLINKPITGNVGILNSQIFFIKRC